MPRPPNGRPVHSDAGFAVRQIDQAFPIVQFDPAHAGSTNWRRIRPPPPPKIPKPRVPLPALATRRGRVFMTAQRPRGLSPWPLTGYPSKPHIGPSPPLVDRQLRPPLDLFDPGGVDRRPARPAWRRWPTGAALHGGPHQSARTATGSEPELPGEWLIEQFTARVGTMPRTCCSAQDLTAMEIWTPSGLDRNRRRVGGPQGDGDGDPRVRARAASFAAGA